MRFDEPRKYMIVSLVHCCCTALEDLVQAVLTTVVWLGGIKKEKDGSALSYVYCFLINKWIGFFSYVYCFLINKWISYFSYVYCFLINKWIGYSVGSEMRYILMGIRNATIEFCQVSHMVNIHA